MRLVAARIALILSGLLLGWLVAGMSVLAGMLMVDVANASRSFTMHSPMLSSMASEAVSSLAVSRGASRLRRSAVTSLGSNLY